ncbi:hypothetical protein DPMN_190548 [Dreissena polymorpha]|uniref:Uncharacterized protein n=1 Tax=Dreissena polymorpha TaxID=45954 RepID=A0A9D4DUD3_DREPO|nr:hypothetical protein DPMN_190548 [Dreissena polymorpha]
MYEKIRNVGNHLHNVKVLRDGQGQLFVSYRQRHNQRVAADEYGPCPYCYGYYPKKILWRHTQRCKFTNAAGSRKRLALERQPAIIKIKRRKHYFKTSNRVHEKRRNKSYSQSDNTILAFGEKFCTKRGHDEEQHNYIRQKLREVGRLLKDMRSCSGKVEKSLENVMYPDAFKFITQSCKKRCRLRRKHQYLCYTIISLKDWHNASEMSKNSNFERNRNKQPGSANKG